MKPLLAVFSRKSIPTNLYLIQQLIKARREIRKLREERELLIDELCAVRLELYAEQDK